MFGGLSYEANFRAEKWRIFGIIRVEIINGK